MILQTSPKLKMLGNGERIPANAVCYGETTSGKVGWCGPGTLAGVKWKKYAINTPSIIMEVKND